MKIRIIATIFVFSISLLTVQCKNKKTNNKELVQTNIEENNLKSEHDMKKPSTIVTEELVRKIFDIPAEEIIIKYDSDGKCSYDWGVGLQSFHLDFMFYFPGELNDEKSEKYFFDLTKPESFLEEKDKPIAITDIADKAIWSNIGGGQLVAKKGNEIMILNTNTIDLTNYNNLGYTDENIRKELISKGKTIINEVINTLKL
ncbi:MAG: hypothetical protein PHC28_03830 [Flavobacterium sp.]|uniref:hypothetical protein n=1 Tax=Flavobacterium sp. TaxID=239 RepID=UPI002621E771|nr:hypothetical protein [Flavobacterium sp.]MDD5149595.1 hypothetical protein [Flavobacterium sp.]